MITNWRIEWKPFVVIAVAFLACFYIPVELLPFENALTEALYLVQEYARLHVLTCLIPAFFIAGAIAVFISQAAVVKYFGARANKALAYGVASVSGTILAVCSYGARPRPGAWRGARDRRSRLQHSPRPADAPVLSPGRARQG